MNRNLGLLRQEGIHAGLVMVKPHAMDQVLDPLVHDLLSGGEVSRYLNMDDPLVAMLGSMSVAQPVIRDLRTSPCGNDLIKLFYGDKSNKRYFSMIREYYMGKVAFLPYYHTIPVAGQERLFDAIKGATHTYNEHGDDVTLPRGVRGLLGQPYIYFGKEAAASMDDETYRVAFSPMVNNYIHVCDSEPEITAALQILYTKDELDSVTNATIAQMVTDLSA